MKKNVKIIKAAFPHTLAVLLGYLFMGMAFGILLVEKGYSPFLAFIMGVTILSGAMQFISITLLIGNFSPLYIIMMTVLVNFRYMFYGISMLDKFSLMGKRKWYMIFSLTDETYSLHCLVKAPPDIDSQDFALAISALNHFYWVVGCTLGGVLGSLVSFNTAGIDFAMTALFVVVAVEQWQQTDSHLPAVLGVLISLFSLLIVGPQNFTLPAVILIIIALFALQKRIVKIKKDGGGLE